MICIISRSLQEVVVQHYNTGHILTLIAHQTYTHTIGSAESVGSGQCQRCRNTVRKRNRPAALPADEWHRPAASDRRESANRRQPVAHFHSQTHSATQRKLLIQNYI